MIYSQLSAVTTSVNTYRDVDFVEHRYTLLRVDERDVLWCADDNRTVDEYQLTKRKLHITSAWRHVDHERIQFPSF